MHLLTLVLKSTLIIVLHTMCLIKGWFSIIMFIYENILCAYIFLGFAFQLIQNRFNKLWNYRLNFLIVSFLEIRYLQSYYDLQPITLMSNYDMCIPCFLLFGLIWIIDFSFGGQEKNVQGKHGLHGDINVLLLGDPVNTKSHCLK